MLQPAENLPDQGALVVGDSWAIKVIVHADPDYRARKVNRCRSLGATKDNTVKQTAGTSADLR